MQRSVIRMSGLSHCMGVCILLVAAVAVLAATPSNALESRFRQNIDVRKLEEVCWAWL